MGEQKRRFSAQNGMLSHSIFDGERLTIATAMDVEPTLNLVARSRDTLRNTGDNKVLGHLPAIIVQQLIHRGIFHDPDAFDRWWNSFEADPWRVWDGRV
jgi:hypothetical protein